MELDFILNTKKQPLHLFEGIFSSFGINKENEFYYNYFDYKNNTKNEKNYTNCNKLRCGCNCSPMKQNVSIIVSSNNFCSSMKPSIISCNNSCSATLDDLKYLCDQEFMIIKD
ncbi:hypothetical protein RB653_005936 [Dictyostelium firmibasis]|uniref:Uncharacterized protein n=1 Tax=Dictyostelium firmibasis TaxID=79012 RepID=A0AAN7U8W6_9MYCE